MTFTQKYGKNIGAHANFAAGRATPINFNQAVFCDGCAAQCQLGFGYSIACDEGLYPTIDGRIIDVYLGQTGAQKLFHPQESCEPLNLRQICAIYAARRIARLCDHYQKAK